MKNDKKKVVKQTANEIVEEKLDSKQMKRQIIIETDGNNVDLIKNETSGVIELVGVLQGLLTYLMNKK